MREGRVEECGRRHPVLRAQLQRQPGDQELPNAEAVLYAYIYIYTTYRIHVTLVSTRR